MTPEQHERWLDFATRMALHAHPDATQAERDEAEAIVRDYIDGYESVAGDIHGWDGEGGKVYRNSARKAPSFRAGMDSAGGASHLAFVPVLF